MYYEKNKWISLISVIAAAINILLNAIFLPIYGFLAAGWTTLVSYMILAFLHLCCIRRELPAKCCLFPVCLCEILATGAVLFVYSTDWLRYILLAGMIVSVFLLRKRVPTLLKGSTWLFH